MNNEQFWQSILSELEVLISKTNFITWFKHTNIKEKTDKKLIVSVPNGFTKEWLKNKYHKLILKAIQKFSPEIKQLEYVIGQNINIPAPGGMEHEKQPQKQQANSKKPTLNPLYIFERFVIGSSNQLAHATCLSAAEKPGKNYNPVFIYGGAGLGKTHLLQAVGNKIIKQEKTNKICYVSADKFTSELVTSIRNNSIDKFKKKYHEYDCLIIDDIQFIGGKEKTQEEFFHIFNNLYEKNKQIVLSSDRPPKAIHTLENRLRSRFEGGIMADVTFPELETRIAILQNKLKEKEFNLSEKILEKVAVNIKNNVRELEGALNRIIAYAQINNIEPDIKEVDKILFSLVKQPKIEKTNIKDIIKTVAKFYNVKSKDIIKKNRQREVVKARQIIMYLMREELDNSYPHIGERIGGRDHTTAIYAYKKINKKISQDNALCEEVNLIKQQLSI